jgi:hypothetical protein
MTKSVRSVKIQRLQIIGLVTVYMYGSLIMCIRSHFARKVNSCVDYRNTGQIFSTFFFEG